MIKSALIGQAITGSFTPEMHEAEAVAQGFQYNYERWDTMKEPYASLSLDALLLQAEEQGLCGVNITHPFKDRVRVLVDEVTGAAKMIGTLNTVKFSNGKRIGHNTDYFGFMKAFESELKEESRARVLLIGAGGAGTAVALALIDIGVNWLGIYDISAIRSSELVRRILQERPQANVEAVKALSPQQFENLDGLVNATPVGMDHHLGTPIDINCLSSNSWVSDIIYFPSETQLLREAKNKGCKTTNGTKMALYQAVQAFEIITGHTPDVERMSVSLQTLTKERNQAKAKQ